MPNYPSECDLKKIEKWDTLKDPIGLIEFITPLFEEMGSVRLTGKRIKKLYLATGGWSGNEQIIGALGRNIMFWMVYWMKSERGGAFTFRIMPIKGVV